MQYNLPFTYFNSIKCILCFVSQLLYKYMYIFYYRLPNIDIMLSNSNHKIILNKIFLKVSNVYITVLHDVLLRVLCCCSLNAFECVYQYSYCYFAWKSRFKIKMVAYFTILNNYNLSQKFSVTGFMFPFLYCIIYTFTFTKLYINCFMSI